MTVPRDSNSRDGLAGLESRLMRERFSVLAMHADNPRGLDDLAPEVIRATLESDTGRAGLSTVATALELAAAMPSESLSVDRRWSEPSSIPQPALSAMSQVVEASVLALAAGYPAGKDFGATVMQLALGDGVMLDRARRIATGIPVSSRERPGPPGPPGPGIDPRIPPEFADTLDRFVKEGLMRDLRDALSRVGLSVSAAARPKEKAGARIDAIEPNRVCVGAAGGEVSLVGEGFGARRDGDGVYAGTVELEVVANSWTDTRITVKVPAGFAGRYCVSVLENVGKAGASDLGQLQEALTDLDVVYGQFRVGGRSFADGLLALYTPQSTCGPNNQLWVGPPRIERLSAGGVVAPGALRWRPLRALPVSWSVLEADRLEWSLSPLGRTKAAQLPALSMLPTTTLYGSAELPASPIERPWSGRLTLRAHNGCGMVEAAMDVMVLPLTGFIAVGGGSRSVFHAGVLAYTHAHYRRQYDATGGSGLGSLAAMQAALGTDPQALATFWDVVAARPVDDGGYTLLYDKSNALQTAFAEFKRGSYYGLITATTALAEEVHFRGAIGGVTWSTKAFEGKSGATAEKALVASLQKGWPYLVKLGSKIIEKSTGFSQATLAADFATSVIKEPASGHKTKVEEAQAAADPAIAGVVFVVSKINPLVGAAIQLVYQVSFAIAKEVEKADQLARFNAVMDSRAMASYDGLHAALDQWLQTAGLPPSSIGRLTTPVRLAVGILESGIAGYIDEHARVDVPPNSPDGSGTIVPMTWGTALRAAIALPGLVPAVQARTGLANNTISLVDGAVCDSSAIEAVIEAGADELIISIPVLVEASSMTSFAGENFATVMRRAAQMRETRLSALPLDAFKAWRGDSPGGSDVGDYLGRLKVIDATIDLPYINSLELNPGLIDIWRDYGYMRAFDTLAPEAIHAAIDAPGSVVLLERRTTLMAAFDASSAVITALRITAWELEHFINGQRPGSTYNRVLRNLQTSSEWLAEALELRRVKRLIADRIRDRLVRVKTEYASASTDRRWPGPAVPITAARWAQQFERHSWPSQLSTTMGAAPAGPFDAFSLLSHVVSDTPPRTPIDQTIGTLAAEVPPSIDPGLFQP